MRIIENQKPGKPLLLLSILLFAVFLVYRLLLIIQPVTDIGGVENSVIYFIQHLLAGDRLYMNPEAPPYSIAQYSPLYYHLVAALARVAHLHADDVLQIFMVSRCAGLVLNLCYAFIVFLICRRALYASRQTAVIAAIASFVFLDITSFSRPDSLYYLFFFLSLHFFLQHMNRKEKKKRGDIYLMLTAVTAVLSMAVKQSAVILPITIGGWLLWTRSYKELLKFVLLYVGGMLLFVLSMSSNLKAFYMNVILGINNGIHFNWLYNVIIPDFYLKFGLLFVPCAILVYGLLKRKRSAHAQFLAFCLLVFFMLENGMALKSGSHSGYFTEWWTVLIISIAYCEEDLEALTASLYRWLWPSMLIFIFLIRLVPTAYNVYLTITGATWKNNSLYTNEKQLADRIKAQVPENNYQVLCNLFSPESFLNNFLYNRAILPQYDILVFGNGHVYDYSRLKNEIKAGKIKFVVTSTNQNSLQFMDMMLTNYTAIDTIGNRILYVYKQ